jgi:chitinase
LWNNTKKVFLSTEDEQSLGAKADYVVNKGLGGIMIWELAGDYAWNATAGEYRMGDTLTSLLNTKFARRLAVRRLEGEQSTPDTDT